MVDGVLQLFNYGNYFPPSFFLRIRNKKKTPTIDIYSRSYTLMISRPIAIIDGKTCSISPLFRVLFIDPQQAGENGFCSIVFLLYYWPACFEKEEKHVSLLSSFFFFENLVRLTET